MENLSFILSLFNQYCFTDAKNNIESLEYYVNVNPMLSGNTLVTSLLDAIKNYSLETIDLPLFQSILMKDRKNQQEQQEIINELVKWKGYSKEQMEPTKKYLEDIIAGSIIAKANNNFADDPVGYLNFLKQSDINLDRSDALSSLSFGNLDINTMVAESNGRSFSSYFDWINSQFEPTRKVELGQIAVISAPPGTGKTLWMICEALNAAMTTDYKILYVSMGDMKIKDFVVRMGAIQTGMSFADTTRNLSDVYRLLKQFIGNKLDISINPAGTVKVDELVEYVLAKKYDMVFVDYDSNFLMKSSGSMYNDFGDVYNALTKLTLHDIFVMIGSQPHKNVWKEETIGLGDLGESSRKGHIADCAWTLSRLPGSNHCGIVYTAKNRRGEEGDMIGYIRLNNGRFRLIPIQLAKQISTEEKKLYLDADIDQLIDLYNRGSQAINSSGVSRAGKVVNPFNKP